MILGSVADLLWMMYWIPFWNSEEMVKWNKGLHNLVVLSAVGNFLLKIIISVSFYFVTAKEMNNSGRP